MAGNRYRFAFALVTMALAMLSAAVAGEGVLRLAGYEPRIKNVMHYYANHDKYGWVIQPNLHARKISTSEGDYSISTDSEGFRIPESGVSDSNGGIILVVGDSYTFGMDVQYTDGYYSQIETLLASSGTRLRTRTVGIPGWSPFQYRDRVDDYLESEDSKQLRCIILGLTLGNDLDPPPDPAAFEQAKPFIEDGYLVGDWKTGHVRAPWQEEGLLRRLLFAVETETATGSLAARAASQPVVRPLFESIGLARRVGTLAPEFLGKSSTKKGWNSTLPVLLDIGRISSRREIPLIILLIADPAQFYLPEKDRFYVNEVVRRDLRAHDILFADPSLQLSLADYNRGSPHWNVEGHRKAANALVPVLRSVVH